MARGVSRQCARGLPEAPEGRRAVGDHLRGIGGGGPSRRHGVGGGRSSAATAADGHDLEGVGGTPLQSRQCGRGGRATGGDRVAGGSPDVGGDHVGGDGRTVTVGRRPAHAGLTGCPGRRHATGCPGNRARRGAGSRSSHNRGDRADQPEPDQGGADQAGACDQARQTPLRLAAATSAAMDKSGPDAHRRLPPDGRVIPGRIVPRRCVRFKRRNCQCSVWTSPRPTRPTRSWNPVRLSAERPGRPRSASITSTDDGG